ncbi:uncharacterized protein LOC113780971 isoform X2 [Coffea eugenioides]|nr:uncharacterized protein LOC113703378 isoform X2 [Coffea arabica]XP_027080538.1 uncharacterized protein LOC113703378 isoform X2 [Coffea arabica]XP_027080545.1 uncharacterized protein LOC113703378 isoform X2 [Coffea arabica]XP_027080553.1 uncharacterized protein LOC113703378 isoform X2 [Coffea arabica]XP_027182584.1 uncharacterized protein LOC113780971 isoform X2 [Coffea eugenioides]XP_027182592.1 uncharacterized protein LOC113780971 isoform X2 [Coffea eugenioides]
MKRKDRCCDKVVPTPKRNRKSKSEVKVDEFQRLPDELLLSIFTKMPDFKYVCQCSLVCKRFASVITLVHNVTVTFISKECEVSEDLAHIQNAFDKKMSPQNQITPKMDITCLRQTLKFINCLRKFKDLKSVHIKFSYVETSSSTPLEWKTKFGPELEYVVALLPTSIEKKTKQELSQDQEVGDVTWSLTESELEHSLYRAYGCCQETVVRQTILYMLVEHHSMLHSVTITDSEKQGRLCIQDEQLLELKNSFRNKDLEQIFEEVKIPHIFKVGYVPVVRLPALGYLLKGVILLIFKPKEEPSAGDEDVDDNSALLAWQYDDEEVFRETVREMLVNHKERMHLVPRAAEDAVA